MLSPCVMKGWVGAGSEGSRDELTLISQLILFAGRQRLASPFCWTSSHPLFTRRCVPIYPSIHHLPIYLLSICSLSTMAYWDDLPPNFTCNICIVWVCLTLHTVFYVRILYASCSWRNCYCIVLTSKFHALIWSMYIAAKIVLEKQSS